METTQTNLVADQIIREVILLTQEYKEAIKNGKEFSVSREIKDKIKVLTDQLDELLSNENRNN